MKIERRVEHGGMKESDMSSAWMRPAEGRSPDRWSWPAYAFPHYARGDL